MVKWITSHATYQEFFKPDFQIRTAHFYVPGLFRAGDAAVGITISRKNGKAVKRNKLKRRIKAWFVHHSGQFPTGIMLNLVAKPGAAELSWPQLCLQLGELCSQATGKAAR
jgi:ribonuclease P protein component